MKKLCIFMLLLFTVSIINPKTKKDKEIIRAYENVKHNLSIESINSFISEYPNSSYIPELVQIKKNIEMSEYKDIVKINDIQKLLKWINDNPKSKYLKEIKYKYNKILWQFVIENPNLESIAKFEQQYYSEIDNGYYKEFIKAYKDDIYYYLNVSAINTLDSYYDYMANTKLALYRKDAQENIEKLKSMEIIQENQSIVNWHNSEKYKQLYDKKYESFWKSRLYITESNPTNSSIYEYFLYRPLSNPSDPNLSISLTKLEYTNNIYTFSFEIYSKNILTDRSTLYFSKHNDGYLIYKVVYSVKAYSDDGEIFIDRIITDTMAKQVFITNLLYMYEY